MGEIGHKGQRYEGQHPAIVDPEIWQKTRARLGENTYARNIRQGAKDPSLLAGLLYDHSGNRLTPTHCVNKGKRYRYYSRQQSGSHGRRPGRPSDSERRWRIAATEIEMLVIGQLAARCENPHWLNQHCVESDEAVAHRRAIATAGKALAHHLRTDDPPGLREILLNLLSRVVLGDSEVRIEMPRAALLAALAVGQTDIGPERNGGRCEPAARSRPQVAGAITDDYGVASRGSACEMGQESIAISVATKLRRRGAETKLIIDGGDCSEKEPTLDSALIKMVANAHQWWDDLVAHRFETVRELASAYRKNERYVARVLPLAFLEPISIEAIAAGQQPIEMTAQMAISSFDVPFRWVNHGS